MNHRHLEIVRNILTKPTAPYHEEAVIGEVLVLARGWGIRASRDPAGNVYLRYNGPRSRRSWDAAPKGRPAAHWVFAAHMDHPGFSVAVAGGSGKGNGKTVRAHLLGGVDRKYLRGGRVRFFGPAGEVVGTIVSFQESPVRASAPWPLCRVALDRLAELPPGTIGMWDFPAYAFRGRRLVSRACDDVIGSAAVLCAMDEIVRRRLPARVTVLLTRAEEDGFIGALAACRDGRLPRGASLVAVEASREQPGARPGDGVVVRVGDRSRTFDPTLTAHVSAVAADLAKRDKGFRHVRLLMPGGTCESTAYVLWGLAATGLCLPLVNYHNMGPDGRVAAEEVDTRDFDCLVKLMVALAAAGRRPADADKALKTRLRLLLKSRERFLREQAAKR